MVLRLLCCSGCKYHYTRRDESPEIPPHPSPGLICTIPQSTFWTDPVLSCILTYGMCAAYAASQQFAKHCCTFFQSIAEERFTNLVYIVLLPTTFGLLPVKRGYFLFLLVYYSWKQGSKILIFLSHNNLQNLPQIYVKVAGRLYIPMPLESSVFYSL